MPKYECWWPECDYCTESRSKIDFHHVTPKEVDSHRTNKVTIPLCKTHHALIYHPSAKYGQHSIKTDESMAILATHATNNGIAIHYESMNGDTMFYYTRTGEVIMD